MKSQVLIILTIYLLCVSYETETPYKTFTGKLYDNCYPVKINSGDIFGSTLSWTNSNQNLDLTLY